MRLYLMFLGPWSQGGEWVDAGINGMARWVNRVWEMAQRDSKSMGKPSDPAMIKHLTRITHKTIRKVTHDMERFHFNTAIAALMEYSNAMNAAWEKNTVDSSTWNQAMDTMLLLLAPSAPHVTEELWERRGHTYSIHNQPVPVWDQNLAADEEITLVVQVNGKVRDKLTVTADISEEAVKNVALASPRIQNHTNEKLIKQLVYVPGRLLNIVTD